MSEEEVNLEEEEVFVGGLDDLPMSYQDYVGVYFLGGLGMFMGSKLVALSAGTPAMTTQQLSYLLLGGIGLTLIGLTTGRMKLWD
jgi:hypothetical protein